MARERYRIGDLIVDVGAAQVRRAGRELAVTGLSFDLLVALARNAPDALGADALAGAVWRQAGVSDETLKQRVALLRRALGDDARDPRYVRSVRGRGYQLVPRAERLPAGRVVDSDAPRAARRLPLAWALGLIVAAALVAVLWPRVPEPAPDGPGLRSEPTTAADFAERAWRELARDRPPDTERGIELARRALEVDGDEAEALAALSYGLAQRVVKFNGPRGDLAEALRLGRRAVEIAPRSAAAHHAVALAMDGAGRSTDALTEYQRSWELDPERLRPLASAAYLLQVRGRLAEALEANLRAARGAPELPYLEVQIGTTLAALGFEAAGAVWLGRAVDLRPDNVFAASAFAGLRLSQGRLDEAEELARDALDRGVVRPELHAILGHVALLRGAEEAAWRHYREASTVGERDVESAVRALALEVRRAAGDPVPRERLEEWVRSLQEARGDGDESPEVSYVSALGLATLGQVGAAAAALDEAVELGLRDPDWLLLDPLLAPLRGRPGFVERLGRIRRLIEAERERVLASDWLPDGLLDPAPRAEAADPARAPRPGS